MKSIPRSVIALLPVVWIALSHSAPAAYPEKHIRLIVTFPAGGTTEIIGRIIPQKLAERLGQLIVVDNRGGMGGSLGTQIAAKAAPDGYTLVLSNVASFTINTVLFKGLGYDPMKDFDPVTSVVAVPNFLVVPASSPYKTLAELIAAARAEPGALTYAGTGIGASPTLAAELLKIMAKVDITEVPYKGAAPAIVDVLSGQVSMKFDNAFAVPYFKAGRLRLLGVSGLKRIGIMPDVPTIAEQGYPGFDVVAWYGIWAPAKSPPEIIRKLNTEINAILKLPDVVERMHGAGMEIMGGTVQEFAAYHRSEFDKWTTFIKNTGIKPQ